MRDYTLPWVYNSTVPWPRTLLYFGPQLIDENQDEEITYDHVLSQFVDNYSDKVDYDSVLKSTKYNKLAKVGLAYYIIAIF